MPSVIIDMFSYLVITPSTFGPITAISGRLSQPVFSSYPAISRIFFP